MSSKKVNVVLVDDNEAFRSAVKVYLEVELNCDVIFEAENGLQFINSPLVNKADIVLMDLNMPVLDGFTAIKKRFMLYPNTKIIAVTMFTEKAYLVPLIEAGFKGCIYKSNFYVEIERTINTVLNGELCFPADLKLTKD